MAGDAPVGTVIQHGADDLLARLAEVAEIVDDERAAAGALERTGMDFPVFLSPEQQLLDQWLVSAGAQRMQVARERAATGARLAADQHGRIVPGILLHLFAQALHQLAAADRREQRRQHPLAAGGLFLRRLQRSLYGAQQLCQRQWLLYEVECAESRRLYGRVDGAVPRHDHDRTRRGAVLRPFT